MSPETIILVDPKKVHISKLNTRQPKKADVSELIQTIRETGQITPALARPHPLRKGEYELAAGARRKVACEALKRPLRLVVQTITDAELEDMILIENLQRVDPDPMQEAALIQRRIAAGVPATEIAARYGKSETWLKRRMKLASLTPQARDAWCEGAAFSHFSTEMMEFIGTLPAEMQNNLADDPWTCRDFGSLKELMEGHHRDGHRLENADWLNDPASFIDGCGPGCSSNSADSLFPDPEEPCGHCMNSDCFNSRLAKLKDARIAALIKDRPLTDFALVCTDGHGGNQSFQGKELKIIPQWQLREHYTLAKKPGPDTRPGIDFSDKLNPRLVHLKPTAQSTRKGADPAATSPTASREDRITAKRLAAIHPKLIEALDNTPVETITARFPILHLVAAFGLSNSRSHCHGIASHQEAWGSLYAEGNVPSFDYHSDTLTREDALWQSIIPILRTRAAFQKNSDLLPDHKQHELRQIAALIGFPWQSTWETICRKEVPVPKSWGPGIDPVTLKPRKAA